MNYLFSIPSLLIFLIGLLVMIFQDKIPKSLIYLIGFTIGTISTILMLNLK